MAEIDALDREIIEVTDRLNERLHRGSNEWKNLNDRERDIDAAMTLFGRLKSDRARLSTALAAAERENTDRAARWPRGR